jgi:DNA-binding MarR family transcriptional regulator
MSPPNKSPRYGPIPLRACRDLRLSASHFRVLTTIAGFDRLGKNGSGCWTSQNRIAEIAHCSKSHLSNILSDLRNADYITSQINPDKRWFRIHRVVYTEEDFNCLGIGKSVHSHRNCLDKSVHSGVNRLVQISSPEAQNQFGSTPSNSSARSSSKSPTMPACLNR